jgi:hypothetical protein
MANKVRPSSQRAAHACRKGAFVCALPSSSARVHDEPGVLQVAVKHRHGVWHMCPTCMPPETVKGLMVIVADARDVPLLVCRWRCACLGTDAASLMARM